MDRYQFQEKLKEMGFNINKVDISDLEKLLIEIQEDNDPDESYRVAYEDGRKEGYDSGYLDGYDEAREHMADLKYITEMAKWEHEGYKGYYSNDTCPYAENSNAEEYWILGWNEAADDDWKRNAN